MSEFRLFNGVGCPRHAAPWPSDLPRTGPRPKRPVLNDHPPIFIVGAPRSGTTLLRSFLAASDEIAIPPESHFLVYLFHRYQSRMRRWTPADTTRVLRDVIIDAHFLDWKLPASLVWEESEREPPASFPEAITCPHRAYARREGKRWWGDKT